MAKRIIVCNESLLKNVLGNLQDYSEIEFCNCGCRRYSVKASFAPPLGQTCSRIERMDRDELLSEVFALLLVKNKGWASKLCTCGCGGIEPEEKTDLRVHVYTLSTCSEDCDCCKVAVKAAIWDKF